MLAAGDLRIARVERLAVDGALSVGDHKQRVVEVAPKADPRQDLRADQRPAGVGQRVVRERRAHREREAVGGLLRVVQHEPQLQARGDAQRFEAAQHLRKILRVDDHVHAPLLCLQRKGPRGLCWEPHSLDQHTGRHATSAAEVRPRQVSGRRGPWQDAT